MTELLLGDEAVGIAAIDAGISGMFSYPGTPATEIFEFVERRTAGDDSVVARWSANEKVAYEEALGMSFIGKRSLVAMKHVGLNVAADPFVNSALTGAYGGLVLAVADDPSMHSSQNEQDSRFFGDFAQIPMFEPSNQQEAYEMTREAFERSESFGLPILLRLVTRLAHSRSNVIRRDAAKARAIDGYPDTRDWTLLPVNARRRFRRLLDLQESLRGYSEESPFNSLTLRGPRGIITSGIGHNYVREVLGDDSSYSILKIGVYPLPTKLIRQLIDHCEEIFVMEEGYPFIEDRLNGLLGIPGKAIMGKRTGHLSLDGELTADTVRAGLGMTALDALKPADGLPPRPPALCKGCPHIDTFQAVQEAIKPFDNAILFSDIGCYTLGALPPFNAVDSCVDMGASVSMAIGAAKGGAHPVLCAIGDSTFTHSGMTPLLGAAHNDNNITVILLDNATVGMTGGQPTLGTGEGLLKIVEGLGVSADHIVQLEPLKRNHEENVKLVRREVDHKGLSVIVAQRPCIQIRPPAKPTTEKVTASA